MQAVDARTVCAAAFAGGFADVYPAFRKALAEQGAIIFAEYRQPLYDQIAGFLIFEFQSRILHKRNINVVHMLFVQFQYFFPQRNVAVHGRQAVVYGFEQILVNAGRNVFGKQCLLQTTLVAARFCQVHVFFHGAVIDGGERIGQTYIGTVILLKCAAAEIPAALVQNDAVRSVRQFDLLPFFVLNFAETQVGVVDHGKDILEL